MSDEDWSLIAYAAMVGIPWWIWTLVAARAILERCARQEDRSVSEGTVIEP